MMMTFSLENDRRNARNPKKKKKPGEYGVRIPTREKKKI